MTSVAFQDYFYIISVQFTMFILWCPLIVEITMTGLHVVLCVEYLLQLAEFFIRGMSVVPESSSTTTPSTPSGL